METGASDEAGSSLGSLVNDSCLRRDGRSAGFTCVGPRSVQKAMSHWAAIQEEGGARNIPSLLRDQLADRSLSSSTKSTHDGCLCKMQLPRELLKRRDRRKILPGHFLRYVNDICDLLLG